MRVEVRIGDFEKTYVMVVTRAPRRYDYGYTVSLASYKPGTKPEDPTFRLVAIDAGFVEHQMGRYSSGLYAGEYFDGEHEAFILTRAQVQELMVARFTSLEGEKGDGE